MARRRFNPRQPREKNGKWTKGGGSSSKARARSSAKSPAKKKELTNSDYTKRAIASGVGAALSAATGRPVLAGLQGVSVATNAYRVGSNIAAKRNKNSKTKTAAQKRNFTVRRNNIDRLVGRVEKATNVALVGAGLLDFATQAGGLYLAGNKPGPRLAKAAGALGSGGAGLKVKRAGRGGVYNITSVKR